MGGFGRSQRSCLEGFVKPAHLLLELSVFMWEFTHQLVKHLLYTRHPFQLGAGGTKTNRILSLPSKTSESYWERDLSW